MNVFYMFLPHVPVVCKGALCHDLHLKTGTAAPLRPPQTRQVEDTEHKTQVLFYGDNDESYTVCGSANVYVCNVIIDIKL